MKLIVPLFLILIISFSSQASWLDRYQQEERAYYNLEQKLLKQFGGADSELKLKPLISELKSRGSLFYLRKYLKKEFDMGVRNPEHYLWHLDILIKINDIGALMKSLKTWEPKSLEKLLNSKEKDFYRYATFQADIENHNLNSKVIASLLKTSYRDEVLSKVALRKAYEEKRNYKEIKQALLLKKRPLYEDKLILAILGECQKFGKEFKKFCNLRGKKLEELQTKYVEVSLLQLLYDKSQEIED